MTQLTCHLKDVSEDVIWHFLASLNHLDPLVDAVPAYHPKSTYDLSVALRFERMYVLKRAQHHHYNNSILAS